MLPEKREFKPTAPDSSRYFRHRRGLLVVSKVDGSETLKIGRVSVTMSDDGADVSSLAAFDALPQSRPSSYQEEYETEVRDVVGFEPATFYEDGSVATAEPVLGEPKKVKKTRTVHVPAWPNGFGLAVTSAAFEALKADCFKDEDGKTEKPADEVGKAPSGGTPSAPERKRARRRRGAGSDEPSEG